MAVFGAVTVLLTGVLAATIAGADFGSTAPYTAIFTDASGLRTGNDVRIAGVKVGTVESVQVHDRTYAEVHFGLDANRRLPADITATVKYKNLVGQRYLSLDASTGDPNRILRPGSVIPKSHTRPALNLTALFNGFKPLFAALNPKQVNTLSYEIIQVLQGEGGTISDILAHTASLTTTIAKKDTVIGQVIDNLNQVLDTVNARGGELSTLIAQLQQLVSGLSAHRDSIGHAIGALDRLTNTTAGLLADVRAPLRSDVDGLGKLAGNLAAQGPLLNQLLHNAPRRLKAFTRTVSYGSWFNYFLCSVDGTIGYKPLDITIQISPLPLSQQPARCRS
jgi:phospholipid/cholesterol/gamma-HCH transport system substrate-binding protein